MTCYSLYAEERKGWVKIQVQNFGKSWRDGRAFLGIVSSIMPSMFANK